MKCTRTDHSLGHVAAKHSRTFNLKHLQIIKGLEKNKYLQKIHILIMQRMSKICIYYMVIIALSSTTDYFTRISNLIILLHASEVIMCHISWRLQACNMLWHIVHFYNHANKASFNMKDAL